VRAVGWLGANQAAGGNDMEEITLFLNTAPRHFADWLEKHTLMIHGSDFPTERGRIALQRARSTGLWEKPSKVTLEGIYITAGEDDQSEKAFPIGECIRFDLLELAPPPAARIEVSARCGQPVVLDYFRELLSRIAERWPETDTTVTKHLGALTTKDAKETVTQAETLQLAQEFTFDANAKEVRDYMMVGQVPARVVEMTDAHWAFKGILSFAPAPGALYAGTITVYVCSGDRVDPTREDATWLVWDKEVAEIALRQERPGECKAGLYIETNPLAWYHEESASQPWMVPMAVGTRFLSDFWQSLVQNWLDSRATQLGVPVFRNESKVKTGGPTIRTQERAAVFKRLKDAHPGWSQSRVAMEAIDELGEVVTADSVRNAYRAMGWKWERADRIR